MTLKKSFFPAQLFFSPHNTQTRADTDTDTVRCQDNEYRHHTFCLISRCPPPPCSTFSTLTSSAVQFYLHQPLISRTAAQRLPAGGRGPARPVPCSGVGVAPPRSQRVFIKPGAGARLPLKRIKTYSHAGKKARLK